MEFKPCLPAETILGITISLRESIGTYPIQKNFLFFSSHAGTKRDSDFYSLACRLHKINFLETCPTFSTEKTYSIRYSKSILIIPQDIWSYLPRLTQNRIILIFSTSLHNLSYLTEYQANKVCNEYVENMQRNYSLHTFFMTKLKRVNLAYK